MNRYTSHPCKLFNRLLASVLLQVLFLMMACLGLASTAQAAAPVHQATGTPVFGRNLAVSPAWPAHAVDDVALLITETKGGDAVTLSVPAGFALIDFQEQGTRTRISYYWARASSTTMATPSIVTVDHISAVILTYRGVAGTGNPWDVFGGSANSSGGNPKSVSSITTTVPKTLVVQAASRDNDLASTVAFSGQTNATLTGIVERFDNGTDLGNGGGFAVWDGVMNTAGATNQTTYNITPGARSAWMSVALRPPSTTLATGTDPAAATIGPGAAATDVDGFTLQTSGGTETITSVTVNLSTNAGVGVLAITDSAGVVLGSTTTPVIGLNTITVSGMSAIAASATAFKVRVTPLSHAAMPAVPGASYAITANVTAWAGTNEHTGTDTSPILTIDNLSPASATATAAGNAAHRPSDLDRHRFSWPRLEPLDVERHPIAFRRIGAVENVLVRRHPRRGQDSRKVERDDASDLCPQWLGPALLLEWNDLRVTDRDDHLRTIDQLQNPRGFDENRDRRRGRNRPRRHRVRTRRGDRRVERIERLFRTVEGTAGNDDTGDSKGACNRAPHFASSFLPRRIDSGCRSR